MRVNITGKGLIPSLRRLAPVYDQELSEPEIRRVLGIPSLRISDVRTNKPITRKNIDDILRGDKIITTSAKSITSIPDIKEPETIIETTPVVEEPIIEKNEITEISESNTIKEIVKEDVIEISNPSEQVMEVAEQPQTYINRKKKNKRNRS